MSGGDSGIRVDLRHFPAGRARHASSHLHLVGIHLGPPVWATCACDGPPTRRLQSHGDTDLVPAGFSGEWDDEAPGTVLTLLVPQTYLADCAGQSESLNLTPRLGFKDAQLQMLAQILHLEHQQHGETGASYSEALIQALLRRLLHLHGLDHPSPTARGLSPSQSQILLEHIESHLGESLTLDSLAEVVDLSPSHFKVLFKRTHGLPVHRFVLQRRVEGARQLLLQGMTVSQTAAATGFAQQSHLAQWMRRLTGLSPSQVRGGICSSGVRT